MITLVFAMDRKGAIGYENKLPWHLPSDLKFFKRVTMGHPIVMGRKTYTSIGKPLPGRENIVITRDPDFAPEGVKVVHSPEEAARLYPDQEVFVIGGSEIFRVFLPLADRMIVTHIDYEFPADTYFPAFSREDWKEVSREAGTTDEKNAYPHTFVVYDRV